MTRTSMTRPLTLALTLSVTIAASASLASAQDRSAQDRSAQDTWLILPVGIGEEPGLVLDHARLTAATLETTVGATVLQGQRLQHRLQNAVSLPYTEPPADDLAAQLAEAEPELLSAVSRQRDGEVIDRVGTFLEQARQSLALQRDAGASTNLARICGYYVRAHLHGSGESEARQRVRQCLALVPGFTLGERHPPNVRELYAQERRDLRGAIVVSSSPDDPPTCTVRVGGRDIGRTPTARVAVPPGDYRVQVECSDRPGRVHRVHVERAPVELTIRATLDDALRTEPPALVYASSSALQMLPTDIAHAARAVGANYALAVIQRDPREGMMRSFRITDDARGQAMAERSFEIHADPDRIRQSAVALARSALGDPSSDGGGEDGGISPIGPILLAVGGLPLVTGLIVAAVGLSQNQALIDRCPERVGCNEAMRSDVEATRNLGLAGDVLWIAGASVALVGFILTLTLEEGDDDESSAELELRGTPGGGMVALRWRVQ